MIFGRKKKQKLDEDELETNLDNAVEDDDLDEGDDLDEDDLEHDDDLDDDDELDEDDDDLGEDDDDLDADDDEDLEEDDEDDDLDDEDPEDDVQDVMVDHDLREDGPFDITEVDLDADDIERLDFGCLVLTPFDNMQIQLQVDQATNSVQSALIMAEDSALEVALFAAPARTSMVQDVADDMVSATLAAEGEASVTEGPFGPEIRRVIPVEGPNGEEAYHVSRTWFAQGQRWLLRGVLMGEAGMAEDFSGAGELLFEFFCNVVVRRGEEPMVPGDLIPMTLPEGLVDSAPSQD